jgi:pimeloyl-ACP methyl ester carboxylesterase
MKLEGIGGPAPESFRDIVEGVELHWTARGTGSTVVVLHGLSDSEGTWWPVMAELGRRHRVLGLDLPGCGLSARPDASYSLDWHARLVAAWLDRIGVTTCDVVGHSFGGGLAMWLLLYRADAIRRLALVAPGGLGQEVAIELRLAALPFVVEHAGQPWMGAVTRLMMYLNGRSLSADEHRRVRGMNSAPGTARAFARTVRDVIDWRGQTRHFLQRAREVQALPAIALFWGENDRIIPIRQGEALCSVLENCTLERFRGAGHFLHWERPRELSDSLLGFFDAGSVSRARLRSAEPEIRSASSATSTRSAGAPLPVSRAKPRV